MAAKRMFSISLIDSDLFLEMPVTAQNLYFHLGMRADDDGFVNNPKKIMRMIRSSEDDMKILIAKRFVIAFESGVIVIRHWRVNNQIRPDRYRETPYMKEKACLYLMGNREYELITTTEVTVGLPDGNQVTPQISLDQDRLVENRKEKYHLEGEILTESDYITLIQRYPETMVEEVISKILNKPYRNCLNVRTISKWCEQRKSNHIYVEESQKCSADDDILMKIAMERR